MFLHPIFQTKLRHTKDRMYFFKQWNIMITKQTRNITKLFPQPQLSQQADIGLHQSSTVSGLRQALLAVTVFPATLNSFSLLELATGTAKVTRTSKERRGMASWCLLHQSSWSTSTKKLDKVVELVGGGSVINGAYPV